jgi:tetratricopeptide (TPR) repeat protein
MKRDPPLVRWAMPERLPASLRHVLESDLTKLFAPVRPLTLTVSAIYGGFSSDFEQRVVLGVEVRTRDSFQTHIVKLGIREEVKPDYQGWKSCVLSQNFASRIFVQLRYADLPSGHAAVIYEDGYLLYGKDRKAHSLEDVVLWTTTDYKPAPESVERVIYQVYTELERWFYVTSSDSRPEEAVAFYRARLHNAQERWTLLERGSAEERAEVQWRTDLRRDVIWILCGHEDYNCSGDPVYLDPYDYVRWGLDTESLPPALVGRSHGDLHGRNVLVGVQRGEAEFPTVFDYGEMSDHNVVAWDFAKLETEMKVRILPRLYDVPEAREALLGLAGFPHWRPQPRDTDVERTLFFHQFEARLAALGENIDAEHAAEATMPLPPELASSNDSVNRLLRVLWRVRKEAALCLGYRRIRKPHAWLSDLYFALAVYGLCNAKPTWKYERAQVRCALVSAGVAAARLEKRRPQLPREFTRAASRTGCLGSYRVPLGTAHRLWKKGKLGTALNVLEKAHREFPCSVPLVQEYALLIADLAERSADDKRLEEALKLLEPLRGLCRRFRDHETLSRLGKVFRNHGDTVWARKPRPYVDFLGKHVADWQYYKQAQECYHEAFQFNRHFYPGINAASLAWIIGEQAKASEIATEVKHICRSINFSELSWDDRLWLFATEGELRLLLGESAEAAVLYKDALAGIDVARDKQMAQSMYNQVCRLWWALGESRVRKVVAQFRTWEQRHGARLAQGPFGNCSQVTRFTTR